MQINYPKYPEQPTENQSENRCHIYITQPQPGTEPPSSEIGDRLARSELADSNPLKYQLSFGSSNEWLFNSIVLMKVCLNTAAIQGDFDDES